MFFHIDKCLSRVQTSLSWRSNSFPYDKLCTSNHFWKSNSEMAYWKSFVLLITVCKLVNQTGELTSCSVDCCQGDLCNKIPETTVKPQPGEVLRLVASQFVWYCPEHVCLTVCPSFVFCFFTLLKVCFFKSLNKHFPFELGSICLLVHVYKFVLPINFVNN